MDTTNTTDAVTTVNSTGAAVATKSNGPSAEQLTLAAAIKTDLQTLETQRDTLATSLSEFKANLLALNEQIDSKQSELRAALGKTKRRFSDATKAKMAASAKARWASRNESQTVAA